MRIWDKAGETSRLREFITRLEKVATEGATHVAVPFTPREKRRGLNYPDGTTRDQATCTKCGRAKRRRSGLFHTQHH